jgi:hypothetical protein
VSIGCLVPSPWLESTAKSIRIELNIRALTAPPVVRTLTNEHSNQPCQLLTGTSAFATTSKLVLMEAPLSPHPGRGFLPSRFSLLRADRLIRPEIFGQ